MITCQIRFYYSITARDVRDFGSGRSGIRTVLANPASVAPDRFLTGFWGSCPYNNETNIDFQSIQAQAHLLLASTVVAL